MKKNVLKVAVLCAMTALVMTGCEKDPLPITTDQQGVANWEQEIQINYAIDGQWQNAIFYQEEDLLSLINSLTGIIRQGHYVTLDPQTQVAGGKETVRYETENEAAFCEWCLKMAMDGYVINSYYDEKNGVYVGVATKK